MASAKRPPRRSRRRRAGPRPRTRYPRSRSRRRLRPPRGQGRGRRPCCPRFPRKVPHRGSPAHDLGGPGDPRQPGRPAERGLGYLGQPAASGGGEVPGARGVTAIGGRLTGRQSPGQPVVREQYVRGAGGGVRLVLGQPAQLGDRERGRRDAPGPLCPPSRAAEFGDERPGLRRGAHVVPEQGGPDHLAGLVDDHHAVLLRRHPDRVRAVEQSVPGLGQSPPPQFGVALGPVRMRGAGLRDDSAVVGLAEQHLGGLRG